MNSVMRIQLAEMKASFGLLYADALWAIPHRTFTLSTPLPTLDWLVEAQRTGEPMSGSWLTSLGEQIQQFDTQILALALYYLLQLPVGVPGKMGRRPVFLSRDALNFRTSARRHRHEDYVTGLHHVVVNLAIKMALGDGYKIGISPDVPSRQQVLMTEMWAALTLGSNNTIKVPRWIWMFRSIGDLGDKRLTQYSDLMIAEALATSRTAVCGNISNIFEEDKTGQFIREAAEYRSREPVATTLDQLYGRSIWTYHTKLQITPPSAISAISVPFNASKMADSYGNGPDPCCKDVKRSGKTFNPFEDD